MPDTSGFDHDTRGRDLPPDWASAFAALPQEAPAADGWQRLLARLPEATTPTALHRSKRRWPLWLSAAAALALAIAIPLRMQPHATATPLATSPAPEHVSAPLAIDARTELADPPVVPAPVETTRTVSPALERTARVDKPRPGKQVNPSLRPIRTAAKPANATRIVASDAAMGAMTDAVGALRTSNRRPEPPSLEPLYVQSAQLEGLLALARDERVSNGTAAALTDNLDARVASIDATLSRSDVSAQGRDDLWHDRVDALRQLVGIETTQRLYSARGQQVDATLVSID